jgi:hypothetical protein
MLIPPIHRRGRDCRLGEAQSGDCSRGIRRRSGRTGWWAARPGWHGAGVSRRSRLRRPMLLALIIGALVVASGAAAFA